MSSRKGKKNPVRKHLATMASSSVRKDEDSDFKIEKSPNSVPQQPLFSAASACASDHIVSKGVEVAENRNIKSAYLKKNRHNKNFQLKINQEIIQYPSNNPCSSKDNSCKKVEDLGLSSVSKKYSKDTLGSSLLFRKYLPVAASKIAPLTIEDIVEAVKEYVGDNFSICRNQDDKDGFAILLNAMIYRIAYEKGNFYTTDWSEEPLLRYVPSNNLMYSDTEYHEEEKRHKFCVFYHNLVSRLLYFVDDTHISKEFSYDLPEINTIAQAVLTLSYVFRANYRFAYLNLRNSLNNPKNFYKFCQKVFQYEDLPYIFTFLLNVSLKLEMFLYLTNDGMHYKLYRDILVYTPEGYPNYSQFEAAGGVQELFDISSFLVGLSKDLQIFVNFERPIADILLSFKDTVQIMETKYPSMLKDNSFMLLKKMCHDLYNNGLQGYESQNVLPFIILRFILQGKVPKFASGDETWFCNNNKESISRYFSRCLLPEIIYEVPRRSRSRSNLQLPLSSEIINRFKDQTIFNQMPYVNESTNFSFGEWLPMLSSLSEEMASLISQS